MQTEGELIYKEPLKLVSDELEPSATTHFDAKAKHRRYWSSKEEENFYKIWGRDNWRLTKHGKNTIIFAQWSEELLQTFGIEIRPEEIQAKVNQTRAKFRQVMKQNDTENNSRKWKKFEIIEKILRNQYRPKDAEPIPPEALENNRDLPTIEIECPEELTTPAKYNSNSQEPHTVGIPEHNGIALEHEAFGKELFNAPFEIKNEVLYPNYQYEAEQPYAESTVAVEPQSELHHLQTSQQQFQIENQYQAEAPMSSVQTNGIPLLHPEQLLERHIQQLQQEHSQQVPQHESTGFPQTDSYMSNAVPTVPSNAPAHQNEAHENTTEISDKKTTAHHSNSVYNGVSNIYENINCQLAKDKSTTFKVDVKVPGSSLTLGVRKRRATTGGDSVETIFLEEIRKKNSILEERKDISRRLLEVEERKISLMEDFMPKFLGLQEKIWQKLNNS